MRGFERIATGAIAAVLIFACSTAPADARRFRFRVPGFFASSGTAQKIDQVEDLPDTETFERDGLYYNLGYLHDEGDKANGSYVLYNGDKFMRIDTPAEEALTDALGRNPIEAHRDTIAEETGHKPATGVTLQPRVGESREDFRKRALAFAADKQSDSNRQEVEAPSAPAPSRWGSSFLIWIVLAFGAALIFGGRRFLGGLAKSAAGVAGTIDRKALGDSDAPVSHTSFDDAVAARLHEISPEKASPSVVASAPPVVTAQRTFGRRTI